MAGEHTTPKHPFVYTYRRTALLLALFSIDRIYNIFRLIVKYTIRSMCAMSYMQIEIDLIILERDSMDFLHESLVRTGR